MQRLGRDDQQLTDDLGEPAGVMVSARPIGSEYQLMDVGGAWFHGVPACKSSTTSGRPAWARGSPARGSRENTHTLASEAG